MLFVQGHTFQFIISRAYFFEFYYIFTNKIIYNDISLLSEANLNYIQYFIFQKVGSGAWW